MLIQNQALNINKSTWINACAGAGKTTLLVGRIIKLLLHKQENILCLAFTNIAALEMYQRIWFQLSAWQSLDLPSLKKAIEIYISSPTTEILEHARSLFLKFQDYVQISTIHAFCLNTLKNYNSFSFSSIEIIEDTDPLYIKALQYVLKNFNFENFEYLSQKQLVNYVLAFFSDYTAALNDAEYIKNLEQKIKATNICLIQIPLDNLKNIIEILEKGSIREAKYAQLLKQNDFQKVFLDSKNQAKSLAQVVTKKTIQNYPQLLNDLADLQTIYLGNEENLCQQKIYQQTYTLIPLLKQVNLQYHELKGEAISYAEVIHSTLELLEEQPWILLEIDKKIDHLLVDESQDNNLAQWLVIQKITSEFFAGYGSRSLNRTMFVIGDVKQCVYGFQKASPDLFKAIQSGYMNLSQWNFIDFNITYRNSFYIIELVKALYPYFHSIGGAPDYEIIRKNAIGKVEIWPLFTMNEKNTNNEEWLAAYGIIEQIDSWLKEKRILINKNRIIKLSDILILVRRRTKFVEYIIEAAQVYGLSIVREDNFNALETPLGKLLINLLELVLLPEDDLILVKVLRSPIFSLTEVEIFNLAYEREEETIFSRLKSNFFNQYTIIKNWQLISEPALLYMTVLSKELRVKLISIFGTDTTFIIDALIEAAFKFNTLSTFLYWCEDNTLKVKNPIKHSDTLRINTIHGAKGTESAIVFLADTTTIPRLCNFNLLEIEGLPLFIHGLLPKAFISEKKIILDEIYKEYLRLLYVAITRAEDELYIIGTKKAEKGCWYSLISQSYAPEKLLEK